MQLRGRCMFRAEWLLSTTAKGNFVKRFLRVSSGLLMTSLAATFGVGLSVSAASASTRGPSASSSTPSPQLTGNGGLAGIACTSATSCVAVGFQGSSIDLNARTPIVVDVSSGVPGPVQSVATGSSGELHSVACGSATSCVAVGAAYGSAGTVLVVPILNGVPGTPQSIQAGLYNLASVTCSSASTCLAVGSGRAGTGANGDYGYAGYVVPITNGVAGAPKLVPNTAELDGIACTSTTDCIAVGTNGVPLSGSGQAVIVKVTNGVPEAPQVLSGTFGLVGIACSTTAIACVSTGTSSQDSAGNTVGQVVPINNGVVGAAQSVAGTSSIGSVACVSGTRCQALGLASDGATSTLIPITSGSAGAPESVSNTDGDTILGIACSSSGSCEAAGHTSDSSSNSEGFVIEIPAATAPTAPSGVTAQAGNGSAMVSWTAPSSDGGSAITGYTVTASPGGQSCTTTGATSCTVTGLTNGTAYTFTVTATNSVGTSPASSPSAPATPSGTATSASDYLPQIPTRVLSEQVLTAGSAYRFQLPTSVLQGAGAVALNVTAVHPSDVGNLRVYADCGTGPSTTSLLNYQPGKDTANFVIVPLQCTSGSAPVRTIDFYSANANVTVDADLEGVYPTTTTGSGSSTVYTTPGFAGVGFPTRAVDTRSGLGGQTGPIPANTTHSFTLTGLAPGAKAVALNVTSIRPNGPGNLRVYPGDETTVPSTSNVNFIPGVDKAGFVIVNLPADGSDTVNVHSAGTADNVAVDVFGYFPASATTTGLTQPQRVLDTRTGSGLTQGLPNPLAAGVPYPVTVTGNGVPADAQAVVVSLTAIHTASGTGVGNLRAYPAGGAEPNVSNINFISPTADVANLAIVQIGANGQINLVTSGSPIDAAVDILGYVPAAS